MWNGLSVNSQTGTRSHPHPWLCLQNESRMGRAPRQALSQDLSPMSSCRRAGASLPQDTKCVRHLQPSGIMCVLHPKEMERVLPPQSQGKAMAMLIQAGKKFVCSCRSPPGDLGTKRPGQRNELPPVWHGQPRSFSNLDMSSVAPWQ